MTSLIRNVALHGYAAAAHAIGVNPKEQLARVDLSADVLKRSDQFISYLAFIRLLENTASAGRCDDFGLRLAALQMTDMEGPLTLLMRYADSLQDAMALGAQYGYVFSPAMRASLVPVQDHPEWVDLTLIINTASQISCIQTTEYVLYGVVLLLRWMSNGKIIPEMILVPHGRRATIPQYARYLGCECRFDMPFAAIRVATKDLSVPLPERNPLRLEMARSYIEQNFGSSRSLISDRVRVLLRQ
jgi:hypothetical protein